MLPRPRRPTFPSEQERFSPRAGAPVYHRRMKWEQVCKLALDLPEVVEDFWFRTPALKVRGKGFCRLREEGDVIVFLTESVDEQEFLIESRPEIYYITDHYRGWPAVLARLAALTVPECRLRLERAWRLKAPKALLKQLDLPGNARAKGSARTKARSRPA
jgi:hypothetical protein